MSEHREVEGTPKRRLRGPWLWVTIAVIAVMLYALVGFFVVPKVVAGKIVEVAREVLGREASVDRVRFNPFTFRAVIEGFELRDSDGAALLGCERVTADFQASSLFRWAWTFREILIDQPAVVARILPDGRPSVADLLERPEQDPQHERTFELPRILVGRLVVTGGSATFVDQSRSPEFVEAIDPLTLEVRSLTTIPDRSGDHGLTLGFGESAQVRWSGEQQIEPLRLTGRVDVTGVPLVRGWEWLRPLPGLEVVRGTTDVGLRYDLRREPDGRIRVELADGSVITQDLTVRSVAQGQDWLTVPRAELQGVSVRWPEAVIEVGGVRVVDPAVVAWRDREGRDNWTPTLEPLLKERKTDAPASEAISSAAWSAKIGTVDVTGATVRFEDRLMGPDVAFDVSDAVLHVEDITSDPTRPIAVRGSAKIGKAATASFDGQVLAKPLGADVRVEVQDLSFPTVGSYAKTYVNQLPGVQIRSGVLRAEGTARIRGDQEPVLLFEGSAQVDDLDVANRDEDRLLGCEEARAKGVRLTAMPRSLRVGELLLDRGFVKVLIDEAGNLNLTRLARPSPGEPAQIGRDHDKPVPIEVGEIQVRDAEIDFSDLSLFLRFSTRIHSANGTIRDLSTVSAAPATLGIEGRVDATGAFRTEGTLRVAEPFASTDVTVVFRDLELTSYTPYSAEFAGYAIERGLLDLDVRYTIVDRRLVGTHRVIATDLTLGEKVEGAPSTGLPVRLAIGLLKDKNGRIDLDVPIEGSIDSPEFVYRQVFWQAFKQIMVNIAAAPFRAIGRLVGRDEEGIDRVGFSPGHSDLLASEQETLGKLAEEIGPRSELRVEIVGRYDAVSDAEAISQARFEDKLQAGRAAAEAEAEASGRSTSEVALERLYVESFGADRLRQERARFEPVPAAVAPPPAPVEPEKPAKRRKGVEPDSPPPAPPAPVGEFDAAGFYDALRAQLLEAETVTDADLDALARARAESIAGALTASGTLEATRVSVRPPIAVKKKREGREVVESKMTLFADGERSSDEADDE